MIVAETTRCGNSCVPKVKKMISDQMRRREEHNWVIACACKSRGVCVEQKSEYSIVCFQSYGTPQKWRIIGGWGWGGGVCRRKVHPVTYCGTY